MLLTEKVLKHMYSNKGGIIVFTHTGDTIISRVDFSNVRPDGIEKELERFYFDCQGLGVRRLINDLSSKILNPQYNAMQDEDKSQVVALINDDVCCLIIEKNFSYQKGIIDVNHKHLKEISNYLIKLANSSITTQHKVGKMTRLSDSYVCNDYLSFMDEVKDYAKEMKQKKKEGMKSEQQYQLQGWTTGTDMKINNPSNLGSQPVSNGMFNIPEKKVETRTVTRVFVESSRHSDVLEREIDDFLSTRKFISQTSSTITNDYDNIVITVVVIAEEEINN